MIFRYPRGVTTDLLDVLIDSFVCILELHNKDKEKVLSEVSRKQLLGTHYSLGSKF